MRPQRDLAFLGELKGVAQQIEQYLPQPHGVDGEGAEVFLPFDQQVDAGDRVPQRLGACRSRTRCGPIPARSDLLNAGTATRGA
jgi:hypothetical protein